MLATPPLLLPPSPGAVIPSAVPGPSPSSDDSPCTAETRSWTRLLPPVHTTLPGPTAIISPSSTPTGWKTVVEAASPLSDDVDADGSGEAPGVGMGASAVKEAGEPLPP